MCAQWGGGYPRPIVEMTQSLWDFKEILNSAKVPADKQEAIIKQNAQKIKSDMDLADLVYYKQRLWEKEYGKILQNMTKFKQSAEELDLGVRLRRREKKRLREEQDRMTREYEKEQAQIWKQEQLRKLFEV